MRPLHRRRPPLCTPSPEYRHCWRRGPIGGCQHDGSCPHSPHRRCPCVEEGKGEHAVFLVTGVGGVTHFNWARRFGRRMVGCDPQRHQSSCRPVSFSLVPALDRFNLPAHMMQCIGGGVVFLLSADPLPVTLSLTIVLLLVNELASCWARLEPVGTM
ncbi:hypothetical protein D1007_00457 [Hordeum vulgare]|nr:hypothetical protein D1007_00457 [Hordeum vulgare]